MDKENVIHTHTHTHTEEYYSAIKKNEILPYKTTWGHYAKWNKSDRETTNTTWSYLYGEEQIGGLPEAVVEGGWNGWRGPKGTNCQL